MGSGGEEESIKLLTVEKIGSKVLSVSEHTGFNGNDRPKKPEHHICCSTPAPAKVFMYIGGGPEVQCIKAQMAELHGINNESIPSDVNLGRFRCTWSQ
jgi:hypothetical protein